MKWITRLTIVAVFVLGAVAGFMIGMKVERDKFVALQRKSTVSLADRALDRIVSEVKLSPDQKNRLQDILKAIEPILTAAENERRGKVIAAMETVRVNALALLDNAQRERYNNLHKRMKERLTAAAVETTAATAAFLGWQ